jgi:hypothetical protein
MGSCISPAAIRWAYCDIDSSTSEAAAEHMVFLYGMVRTGKEEFVSPDLEQILGRPGIRFQKFEKEHAGLWQAIAFEKGTP